MRGRFCQRHTACSLVLFPPTAEPDARFATRSTRSGSSPPRFRHPVSTANLPGVPPLLPRHLRFEEKARDPQRIAAILLETAETLPGAYKGKPLRASADGHRDDRRRVLPRIGRGVTGATTDTNPVRALLEKERRQGR
jgi:hypothetical protein